MHSPVALPRHLQGIALLLSAQLLLAAMDATAKALSQSFSALLLVWARYTIHFLLMCAFLGPSHGKSLIATKRPVMQAVRALLLLATSSFMIMALRTMPLAESAGLAFVSPLIATLLAIPWLGERVGRAGWLAILGGTIGALLIARPGGGLPVHGVLLVLAAAVCSSVYQILTRQLSQTESSVTMLFYTALCGAACMNLALPWIWDAPELHWPQLLQMTMLGLFGGAGHFLFIHAFRSASVSSLTPFMHVQLIWAALLGWQLFGQLPDGWSVAGMAVIVASGLALALSRRNQV